MCTLWTIFAFGAGDLKVGSFSKFVNNLMTDCSLTMLTVVPDQRGSTKSDNVKMYRVRPSTQV